MRETTPEPNVAAVAVICILVLGLAGIAVAGFIITPPVAWPPSRESLPRLLVAAGLLGVVLAGLQLHIRRHTRLRLTPEGLDVPTFWGGRRRIPWEAVTSARGHGRAGTGIVIESTAGNLSLAPVLFRRPNALVEALEARLGARAAGLPRFEE